MWFDVQDDWHKAHDIAQDIHSSVGSHIHGYLHWQEGDLWNADYWYRSAGLTRPSTSLEAEQEAIIQKLLDS